MNDTPPVPVEDKDIKERIEGFNKELVPLLAKFELGIGAMAKVLPDGRVLADPIIVSVRGRTDVKQQAPATGLAKAE